MIRKRALKAGLVVLGLLFLVGVYPLWRWQPDHVTEQMLGGIYATLGILLLVASRDRSVSRGLIAFTTWSSVVHAAIMAAQVFHK